MTRSGTIYDRWLQWQGSSRWRTLVEAWVKGKIGGWVGENMDVS